MAGSDQNNFGICAKTDTSCGIQIDSRFRKAFQKGVPEKALQKGCGASLAVVFGALPWLGSFCHGLSVPRNFPYRGIFRIVGQVEVNGGFAQMRAICCTATRNNFAENTFTK